MSNPLVAKKWLAELPMAFEATGDSLCSTAETYQRTEDGNRASLQGVDG